MSEKLISRNRDLKRLRDEGYEVEIRSGYLLVHSIPYVNSRREIMYGILATDLTLNNDQTQLPKDHTIWFSGDFPCKSNGSIITALSHQSTTHTLCSGLVVHHKFSCKPSGGYPDYYAKMVRYIEIISNEARAIDPSEKTNPRTFKPIKSLETDSVFVYTDSASSRAGIAAVTEKSVMNKVAIVGLGGTGSYILDLIAKTPVKEIHLFDGDAYLQHNAFRAPGATSYETLENKFSKVDYFTATYSQMRRNIIPHEMYIDDKSIQELSGSDFVFICVDKVAVRKLISDFLHKYKTPFIDTGMEIEFIEDQLCLIGACRVTLSTPVKFDHFPKHVSLEGNAGDDLYRTNIQVADLNALNAVMAVIKWKKYCGFYQDCYKEHQSVYAINAHQLTRDEMVGITAE